MVVKRTSFISLVHAFFIFFVVGCIAPASAVAARSSHDPVLSAYKGHLRHFHTDFESIFLAKRTRFIQSCGILPNIAIHSVGGVFGLSQAPGRLGYSTRDDGFGKISSDDLEVDVDLSCLFTYKNAIRLASSRRSLSCLQFHCALAYDVETYEKNSPRVFGLVNGVKSETDKRSEYSQLRLHQLASRLDWCKDLWRAALLLGYGDHSIFGHARPVLSLAGFYSWKASKLATYRLAMEMGSPVISYPYHIYVGGVPCSSVNSSGCGTIFLSLFLSNAFGASLADKLHVNFKSLYRVLSLSPSVCGTKANSGCVPTSGRLAHGFGLSLDALVHVIDNVLTSSASLAYSSGVIDHTYSVPLMHRYHYLSGYRVCSLYLKGDKIKNVNAVSSMCTLSYNIGARFIVDVKGYYDYFLDGMIGEVESGIRHLFGVDWDLSCKLCKYLTFDIGRVHPSAYLAKGIELKLPSTLYFGLKCNYCGD